MSQEQMLTRLRRDVRSFLISAKHGLTPEQLKRDYQAMLGHPLPLRALGFRNVMDMVKEMPDVVSVEYRLDGSLILRAIADECTKGIEELVSKQRDNKSKGNIRKEKTKTFQVRYPHHQPVILPRRGQAAPTIPAQLRSQLKQLLSHGPIRLSELETRYSAQFAKPLQITQYGFFCISEMLAAATDIIVMQQSRTGTQLLLRSARLPQNQATTHSEKSVKEAGKKPVITTTTAEHSKLQQGSRLHHGVPEPEPLKKKQLFEKTVLKLEEELRQQILEKGTGGTISQELKEKLRKVVAAKSKGISIHNLPAEYKKMYGDELPVTQCGFLSVTEMVGALSDTFSLQPGGEEGENHWVIMEAKMKDTQPTDPELSQGHGTTSSPAAESPNSSGKGYYFSCTESAWEHEELDGSSESQESDTELEVTNKTIHQMVDLFPVLMVSYDAVVPPDAVRSQKLKPPTRRMERELVPVLVERIESPSHFYVRFSQNKEARALENMMIEMRSCYSCSNVIERYSVPDPYIRPGQVCCVAPRDMWFYRVVIHKVLSASEVEVYYVDFGDFTKVERNSLRFLKACYADLPAQAVPSILAGVRPVTSIWTQSGINSFQRMCGERTLVAAIHSYQEDFLTLFLCDTHTEEDVYLHLALQQDGHALPCTMAHGLVSGQFNPVSFYLGDDHLEEIKESPSPSTPSSDTTDGQSSQVHSRGEISRSSSLTVFSSENGESNCPSKHMDPIMDLPELEFINVPQVKDATRNEKVNPLEALQNKDTECSIKWDQGWTDETDKNKTNETNSGPDAKTEDESKLEPVSLAAPVQAVSQPQKCESPAELKPVASTATSPRTPTPIQVNCTLAGVPVYPAHPPISNFMLRLFSSPDRRGLIAPFQHHTSPLALRPAARLSAGASILNWGHIR